MTFSLLLLVLFLSFADQSLLSPFLNPLLQDFFGDTSNVVPLGWVSFVFTAVMAVSTVASGILSDRGSRKRLLLAGCSMFGSASILMSLLPAGRTGYLLFFAGRTLSGLGMGAILPSVFSMVGDTAAASRRGAAFGLVSMSMLVGRMSGFLAAGALTPSWRTAYALTGAAGLLLLPALLFVREPRRGAQEEELQPALRLGAEYRFRINRDDVRYLWSVRSNVWLILNFLDVIPGAILIFLIFKFMKDAHNMEAGPVNFVVFLAMLFGALGALLFGRIGDALYRRDRRGRVFLALACNAVPIVCLVFFITADFRLPEGATLGQALSVPGVWVVLGSVVSAMFINQGVNPNWYGTLTDINLPEHRATMVSLASVMDMAGNALGPLTASYVALLLDLRAALWTALAVWALNIVLWLPVLRHIRRDLDRRREILASRAEGLSRP